VTIYDFDKKIKLSRRAFLLSLGKFGLFSALGARLGYLQLFKSSKYEVLSHKNSISFIMQPPSRGAIMDSNGRLLAVNNREYRLMLNKREYLGRENSLQNLAALLELTPQEIQEIEQKISKAHPKFPVKIMSPLSWEQVAIIEENINQLSGFFVDIGNKRYYPNFNSLCHVVGYVGASSEEEEIDNSLKYVNDFKVGKAGIEKSFDDRLRGEFGYRKMEVNSSGVYLRELESYDSKQGMDINLTIRLELQQYITRLLGDLSAIVIVRDIKHNGAIRALVSSPGYDPNKLTSGINHKDWQEITQNPDHPLVNKAVSSTYPPGSIFKLIVFLTALEHGISPNKNFDCIGYIYVRGIKYRCHKHAGHGVLNMYQAVERSCNSYIYELVMILGPEAIEQMARKLGFGSTTGIELPGEQKGLLPTASWKEANFGQEWSIGDSLNMGIGQGFLAATPLQISGLISSIAGGENNLGASITNSHQNQAGADLDVSHLALRVLRRSMGLVVNSPYGTAYKSRIRGRPQFAGKTGTSQVVSKARSANSRLNSNNRKLKNHGLFVGYIPHDAPRYSCTVIVENGGGGALSAAPIARDIFKYLYNIQPSTDGEE
jgi:penicillin-binding protein 2